MVIYSYPYPAHNYHKLYADMYAGAAEFAGWPFNYLQASDQGKTTFSKSWGAFAIAVGLSRTAGGLIRTFLFGPLLQNASVRMTV